MHYNFRYFMEDDDGAVAVDWVVLTAAIVTVTLVIIPILAPGIVSVASTIETDVLSATLF